MPVRCKPEVEDRAPYAHLEAVSRLLCGLAPWLERESAEPDADLEAQRLNYRTMAVATITSIIDPASPDHVQFNHGRQPLVDAAFLCQALVRAPQQLAQALSPATRALLIDALQSTRAINPPFNNWLCFVGMVEAGLALLGAPHDPVRVETTFRQLEQWYRGDGIYSDGPIFHVDYYNSYVIHPMLLDLAARFPHPPHPPQPSRMPRLLERAQRWAVVQERLVAPDGSFPVVGRSIAYRAAAFQGLAQLALWDQLPESLPRAQVRGALAAAIRRTLEGSANFDEGGWLQIGLCGHQPSLGEHYISTGSLYLCSTALLPLGLSPQHAFWTEPSLPWTSQRVWSGMDAAADRALETPAPPPQSPR